MTELRDRIAAVLYQRYVLTLDVEYSCMEWEDIPDKESWLADADAVIRELPELCARRRCERCRKPCHTDEFPPMRDGSDELRPFCIPCTNHIEWTTS